MAAKNNAAPVGLCLSRESMRELCGTPYKDRQLEFLVLNGVPHYKGLDGWPRVLWSTLEGGASTSTEKPAPAPWRSNKVA